jgi:hypothetical protein
LDFTIAPSFTAENYSEQIQARSQLGKKKTKNMKTSLCSKETIKEEQV